MNRNHLKKRNLVSVVGAGKIFIGKNTIIYDFVVFEVHKRGVVRIGNDCTVHPQCVFITNNKITIGDNCRIACGCKFVSGNHRVAKNKLIRNQKVKVGTVEVGNDCWFGVDVKVLSNVKIGDGAVLGAGAVVTKNVPPYEIWAGVPAKKIGERK